jgi:hypothetical protein
LSIGNFHNAEFLKETGPAVAAQFPVASFIAIAV